MADLRMPDINNVIIVGNLIKDPILRHTTTGTPVANFTIASNRKFRDNSGQWKEDVCFVGVVAWYKLAESCAENLTKGSAVLVEGELQSRQFRTDDGNFRNIVEIKARRVQFLNKREMVLTDIEADEQSSHAEDSEYTPEETTIPSHELSSENEAASPIKDPARETFSFRFRELKF